MANKVYLGIDTNRDGYAPEQCYRTISVMDFIARIDELFGTCLADSLDESWESERKELEDTEIYFRNDVSGSGKPYTYGSLGYYGVDTYVIESDDDEDDE